MTARGFLRLATIVALLLSPALVHAQAAIGSIEGVVSDADSGSPLPYANVIVEGTDFGTMTLDDGSYKLLLPAGSYTIKVLYMGYEDYEAEGVVVIAEQAITLNMGLTPAVSLTVDTIIVEGEEALVDVKSTAERKNVSEDDLKNFAVDNVEEAMALQAGIVMQGGELHVRGGRSGEATFMIDGVPVDDPLGGRVEVSNVAIAEAEATIGGMDAEFGNAQSAVFNIVTKEGGPQFEGSFRLTTDDYGRQDKTYTNYDRLALGMGGPLLSPNFRWYLSAEGVFLDGENLTLDRRDEYKFLGDFIKFKERASSTLNVQNKLTWRVNPKLKLNFETNLNFSANDPYIVNWNQEGYVNRIHIFERLEASGAEGIFFHVIRGTVPVLHGPWFDEYQQNKQLQAQGLPNGFQKVLVSYKPAGSDVAVMEIVDAMRVASAWSGTEFLVLTEELFDGFMDGISQWSYEQNDSSQVYYNSAEHTSTRSNFTNSMKFVAKHTLSDDVFYSLALSRSDFNRHTDVNGKEPYEYLSGGQSALLHNGATDSRVTGVVYSTDPDNPLLATAYDYPEYDDRRSISYTMKFDLTSNRWKGHKFKTGTLIQFNDMKNVSINYPGVTRDLVDDLSGRYLGEAQGLSANNFENQAPLASWYAQDRWEFQGLVANFGMRYDLFSPGNGVEILMRAEGVDPNIDRYKHALSPRLGLAFPITDRDVFHFHYGRFIQAPANNYLFQTQDPNSGIGVLGNPDLKPEITISYQAGIRHQFSANVSGDFALFYKDIYALITTTAVQDTISGNQSYRFINRAYASAQGIEMTLSRAFSDNYGGRIAYTYSFANGVASSALFGASAGGLTHLPTRELPLNWDQRHSLDVSLRIADPGSWGGSVTYSFGSGYPWTPSYRQVRRQDPELENSRRLPATHSLTLTAQKFFNIWGQDLTLFFDGRNLLDQDQVGSISPGIWPGTPHAQIAYVEYLTETDDAGNPQYGGAFLADMDGDGEDEFHPVNDPRVYYPHRIFRIGFGFEF